jgi:hypothetical protein
LSIPSVQPEAQSGYFDMGLNLCLGAAMWCRSSVRG